MVQFEAHHISGSQAGGRARFPGHERHLAREIAGTQAGDDLVHARLGERHINLAARDDEHGIAGRALANHGLARGKGPVAKTARQQLPLGGFQRGEQIHLLQRRNARGQFLGRPLFSLGRWRALHDHGVNGERNLQARALGRVPEARAHLALDLGRLVELVYPVAQGIDDGAVAELDRKTVRRAEGQHARRLARGLDQHLAYLVGRVAVV